MVKALSPNFHQTEAILDPQSRTPDISDEIQQALSRLMGWYDLDAIWKFIRVDSGGRLLVASTSGLASVVNITNVAMTGAAVNVLQANPARSRFEITLGVLGNIFVGFSPTITLANSIFVPPETVYFDDNYSGDVYVIGPNLQTVQVREWV